MPSGWRLISRRDWLSSVSALSVLRGAEPLNAVSPLHAISGRVTPAGLFFVRSHFAEPELSLDSWSLTIEGKVARRTVLNFSDLLESPPRKMEAVLECAGNPASGGAVSNGIWEGVPLAWLIEQAKPEPGATEVLLEGADAGSLLDGAPVHAYSRLAPLARCMEEHSLVAFKLNDRFLPRRNGFPARVLLPGRYGMDSVKWLRRIVLLDADAKPAGYEGGMDRLYTRLVREAGGTRAADRVTEILVKSAIAYPADGAKLWAGEYRVWGFAWAGSAAIRKVEVRLDGGAKWTPAKLESRPERFTWVRWSFRWKAAPGEYALLSRATDDRGREQPLARDPSRVDGYELNWCAPVRCVVK